MTVLPTIPSGGPSAPGRRFWLAALAGGPLGSYPSPPSPTNARKLAESGSPRGGRVATQKFARCTFQLSRQNTTDNRLRDMPLSRRTHTHTQLKSEHDTKSQDTSTRGARGRMRCSLRWITAVPARSQLWRRRSVWMWQIDKRRSCGKVSWHDEAPARERVWGVD